ncbi:MAG: hypothetical protein ACJAXK_000744 [Yoonia sp.]
MKLPHLFGYLIGMSLTTSLAQAQTFCDIFDALVDEAVPTVALPFLPNTVAACTRSLDLSGASSVNCAWPHAYRSAQATAVFDGLLTAVTACADQGIAPVNDQAVNHPDFYDLRLFVVDSFDVGLSIKDKGGLQQTYVFLRVTPTSPK